MKGAIKMQLKSTSVIIMLAVFSLITLAVMIKSKHFFKALVLSAAQGVAALFAVNLLSAATGVSLAVNGVTLALSAIGSLPAVVAMLVSRLFLA